MSLRFPLVLVLLFVLALGCGDDSRAPNASPGPNETPATAAATPTSGSRTPASAPEEPVVPPPTPTVASQVLVDVSGSMRGFVSRSRRTVSVLHEVIDATLASVGRAGPVRHTVGDAIDAVPVPATNLDYDRSSLYSAPTSRLDLVLRRTALPARVDPDHPPAPDLLDDAHITIVLTDGMQVSHAATRGSSAPADGVEAACGAAADPHCITAILKARALDGYGIWLVHIQLPFAGKHFAEVPLDSRMLAVTEEHLRQVAFDTRYNGVEFSAGTLRTHRRDGTSSFRYEGTKPLMLFVLTRDHTMGRRFTSEFSAALRQQPIFAGSMDPAFAVHSIELAPVYDASVHLTTFALAPDSDQAGLPAEARREVRVNGSETRPDGDLDARVWCGAAGKAMLWLSYAQDVSESVVPTFVTEELTLRGPVGRVPAQATAPVESRNDAHAFRLGVNCSRLSAGVTTVGYELNVSRTINEVGLGDEWWSSLSATDTYRAPDCAYGLRDLVLGLLRQSLTTTVGGGRLRLHIDREGE